jgi:divinyl chlorophyllide a 8-vinyl-reductase
MDQTRAPDKTPVLLLGATGTIGRATARELIERGYRVICPVRAGSKSNLVTGAERISADLQDQTALAGLLQGHGVKAILSCMASRTGAPKDAWDVDHDAHLTVLHAAQQAGVTQMVLLSAICVQKPLLSFQRAKLAFESALQSSGLCWSIVRPTAFFKSLSGQVARVQAGKPFLLFGNGDLTACKPISDADLARYLANCLTDTALQGRVLPIGGPGPAMTPREQGQMIFDLLGQPARFRSVPVALMDAIIAGLSVAGKLSANMAAKAELARIGRYYATESMLVWDAQASRYDADATPEYGNDTLRDHYYRLLRGEAQTDLGEHAVF